MICKAEFIDGRWVLPLSDDVVGDLSNPADVEFDVQPRPVNASENRDASASSTGFDSALDDVVSRRASTLQRLAE